MIHELDLSLENLLTHGLGPQLVEQISISFMAPDEDFEKNTTLPAVDLFLYDVRENRELRNTEWSVDRATADRVIRTPPPVRVDCAYMVTAWAAKSSKTPARYEHYLLSEVMKVLLRHPTLPDGVLQGSLRGQQPPLPGITLHSGRLQSPGEFWQALGGKLKAAFHYTATIGVDVHEALDVGPPVTDKSLGFEQVLEGS